ncbi:MAG: molybdopterin converting factor subunit 1 [Elsteraceae bacterium]
MKVLYFAWLRAKIGVAEETVQVPPGCATVADLIEHLKSLSPAHAAAFADLRAIKVAVNQEFARLDSALSAGDEVALFPPVTGG